MCQIGVDGHEGEVLGFVLFQCATNGAETLEAETVWANLCTSQDVQGCKEATCCPNLLPSPWIDCITFWRVEPVWCIGMLLAV